MMERPEFDLCVRVPKRLASAVASASSEYDVTTGEIIRQALTAYLFPNHQDAGRAGPGDADLIHQLQQVVTAASGPAGSVEEIRARLAAHNLDFSLEQGELVLRVKPPSPTALVDERPVPETNYVQSFGHFPGHPHRSAKADRSGSGFEIRAPKTVAR